MPLLEQFLSDNLLLMQVITTSTEAIIISDLVGKTLFWNKASERDFGYTAEEMIGKSIDLIAVEPNDGTKALHVAEVLAKTKSLLKVVRRKRKDGTLIWVSLTISQLRTNENVPIFFIGFSRDVSEDVERQQRLNVLETILEAVSEGILITKFDKDSKERVLFTNAALHKLTGLRENELVKSPVDLLHGLFVDWPKNSGNDVAIANYEVSKHIDEQKCWFGLTTVPVYAENGELANRLYMIRDITHRKHFIDNLQGQNDILRNGQQAIDQVIYGVSHDLRSPLNSILGLTELVRREPYGPQAEIYLSKITQSAAKLNEFIYNIIQYSKNNRTELVLQKIDFGEIFAIAADLHRYTDAGQRTAFQYVNSKSISISSDKDRWQTIFNNLIGNSIKFSRNISNGFIKVEVTKNSEAILVTIEDNGTGIHKDRVSSIFDMFYRADNVRSGSGLGLSIVKQGVEGLGGKITVESQVNSMTKFTIALPLSILYDAG